VRNINANYKSIINRTLSIKGWKLFTTLNSGRRLERTYRDYTPIQSPIFSRFALAWVRNKFQWLLARESTPLIHLPMREGTRGRRSWSGRRIIQRTDNTHSGPVFCRRDKLRRPLNARFLPAAVFHALWTAHMDDVLCYVCPNDRCRMWDTKTSDSEKILQGILLRGFSHRRENSCISNSHIFIFYVNDTYILCRHFLSNSNTRTSDNI